MQPSFHTPATMELKANWYFLSSYAPYLLYLISRSLASHAFGLRTRLASEQREKQEQNKTRTKAKMKPNKTTTRYLGIARQGIHPASVAQ
jgi:hypothetical protein